jgi:thiamine pyrophosphokinase
MEGTGGPQLELYGLKNRRGGVRGAILVLPGATRGCLTRAAALAAMLADRCLLVAVDGGLSVCRAARRRPDLFIGDGDSVRRLPRDVPKVVLPRDKDHSDLAGALSEMRDRRVRVVSVAGLVGGRLDHEWANLFEIGRRAHGFAGILAPTPRGTVIVTRRGCRASTLRERTFSLFALGSPATVSLSGPRWELERRRLEPGSHGLSNRTGTSLELVVHRGTAALVLLPADKRGARGVRRRPTTSPARG